MMIALSLHTRQYGSRWPLYRTTCLMISACHCSSIYQFLAIGCQLWRPKCTEFNFGRGSVPDSTCEACKPIDRLEAATWQGRKGREGRLQHPSFWSRVTPVVHTDQLVARLVKSSLEPSVAVFEWRWTFRLDWITGVAARVVGGCRTITRYFQRDCVMTRQRISAHAQLACTEMFIQNVLCSIHWLWDSNEMQQLRQC